jgi:predicted tellurium resistance membrane protein TerC
MGLRQLYFLLGHLVDKLEYLKFGIAFILAFIGVKLVFHAMHENELPFINGGMPIEWVPVIGTVASLIKLRIEGHKVPPVPAASRAALLDAPLVDDKPVTSDPPAAQ